MSPRVRAGGVAVACVVAVLLLFVLARGPLRSWFGDVVIVVFLDAAVAATGLGSARSRVLGVGAFAVGVEAFQALELVPPDAHWLLHLTIGATADPWDLTAYALGLAAAWVLEARVYAG